MLNLQENLKKYAKLIVQAGCNLKKGQELYIFANLESAPLARLVTEEAYSVGAKKVTVSFTDETIERLCFQNAPMECFTEYPEWRAKLENGVAECGGALLDLTSSDPQALAGIDPKKLIAYSRASHLATKPFHDGMDFGRIVWCIAGAASPAWAKRVFPNCTEDEAVEKLWQAILHTVRVDTPDPIAAWQAHRRSFETRCAFLNEKQFDHLVYHNSIGTDITLGMPKHHIWQGGGSRTVGGTYFFPNMPTEEIFCSPDRTRTEGTVHSALPLSYQGTLIDDFSLTFHKGRVVSCSAAKGEDTLKELLSLDDGAKMLGECALIPKNSPIAETGILFYNTLFDENAACHFALGIGFPECVEGGLDADKEELTAKGVNDSSTHVDFMLGTADLCITGVTASGEEVPIFRDGTWAPGIPAAQA